MSIKSQLQEQNIINQKIKSDRESVELAGMIKKVKASNKNKKKINISTYKNEV